MTPGERFKLNSRSAAVAAPATPVRSSPPTISPTMRRARAERRSKDILRAVADIDTATDPQTARQLLGWLKDTYDLRGGGPLIGLFSMCHLGHPFIDHRVTFTGDILEHYTAADTVPVPFDGARPFAGSYAYIFIEVYADGTVIPIRDSGDPVI